MNMTTPDNQLPLVELIPAAVEQKPILASLLELYSHDFCDFIDLEIGSDGRFGYREVDFYWTDPARFPFLLYIDKRIAGFVLVKSSMREHDTKAWDIAEFFILRGYRGRGMGTKAAQQVWRRFPGSWEVRVMAANEPAYRFWHHAIRSFAGDDVVVTRYKHAGNDWHRFSFQSRPAANDPDLPCIR